MLGRIRVYLDFVRFSHTVFALPFAMLSAVLAWRKPAGEFDWRHLVGIVACMVTARSAAMAFNRVVDARIDADNPRTAARHIPAGIINRRAAILFTLASSFAFVAATLLFLPNRWPLLLAIPVLLFLLGYSWAKRFTSLCHYWLGAALMLSPIATWIALRGDVSVIPLLLGAVVFFWVGGFDIIYACQDADFDRDRRLFSIPARVGVVRALRIAAVSHALAIGCLFALWHEAQLGTIFLLGIVGVATLLIYEHRLVSPLDLTRVNVAFFNVNAIISLGLLALGAIDIWLAV